MPLASRPADLAGIGFCRHHSARSPRICLLYWI